MKTMGQLTRRFDVDTTWIHKFGYVPAKKSMTLEDFRKYENQSEEKIFSARIPSKKVARRLLK
ncbi:MAG: hypothetical protein QF619_11790 [Candidatus Binatia bacterium]|jgi:hypothetical protein|nr:hypothetical protein [Candidatus Binatia bacterium]|tara:strand:+ start:431 stop:619 length:189 start_codon:yes stop_codon:yes gene_type:complete